MDKPERRVAGNRIVIGNHFFKIMIHGYYAERLRIPKAFRTKRLNGVSNCEHAKLCKRGETWHVKVRSDCEEMWLEKGWEEFVQDNEIRLGDLVVFEHVGNMVFDVLLFDPTACEKDCSSSKNKMETIEKEDPLKAAEAYKTSCPHFIKQITATDLHRGVSVPMKFAKPNGLGRHGRKATIREPQRNHSQNVYTKLTFYPGRRVGLGGGSIKFLKANGLRVGDVCVFELDPIAKEKGRIVFDVKLFKGQRNARRI